MKSIAILAIAAKTSAVQINPVNPTGLEPAPRDLQYDGVYQPRAPLIWENWRETNDLKKSYNPNKYENHMGNYLQIDPVNPTGLEPAPKDLQYDGTYQPRAPLIWENWRDTNDWKKSYNPNKYENHMGNYAQKHTSSLLQIDPVHPTGLEPEPRDSQYDGIYQRRAPLIWENWRDTNDWKKSYNGDKYGNSMGNY